MYHLKAFGINFVNKAISLHYKYVIKIEMSKYLHENAGSR